MFSTIDNWFLHVIGTVAGRHSLFDRTTVGLTEANSVKLLPLTAILVYLWFRKDSSERSKSAVIEAVIGMFAAIILSRSIQNLLPLRLRPLHSGTPEFVAPIGTKAEVLEHWSSFPSDHAALSFALSTAVMHVSRPLGTLCYLWSIALVCAPRLYAGYHYASDLFAGAIIGIAAVLCVRLLVPTNAAMTCMNGVAARYPGPFAAALFVLMFFFATMFGDIRLALQGLFKSV